MEQKLKDMINMTRMRIDTATERLEQVREGIARYTQEATANDMILFLPGRMRDLEDEYKTLKALCETLTMLEYLQNSN